MTEKSTAVENCYCLEPVLDLRAAAALKEKLVQLLHAKGPLHIDASRVTRASTACIQVILAFALEVRRAGRHLSFRQASPAIVAAISTLGLGSIILEEKN